MTSPLPCPACGSSTAQRAIASPLWQIVCDMRDGGCGLSSRFADTREEAVRYWNRRRELERLEADRTALTTPLTPDRTLPRVWFDPGEDDSRDSCWVVTNIGGFPTADEALAAYRASLSPQPAPTLEFQQDEFSKGISLGAQPAEPTASTENTMTEPENRSETYIKLNQAIDRYAAAIRTDGHAAAAKALDAVMLEAEHERGLLIVELNCIPLMIGGHYREGVWFLEHPEAPAPIPCKNIPHMVENYLSIIRRFGVQPAEPTGAKNDAELPPDDYVVCCNRSAAKCDCPPDIKEYLAKAQAKHDGVDASHPAEPERATT